MIDLYYWTTPNGHKITLFLEEAGLDYTIKPVNIGEGAQFEPAFLSIAPNNRIPAIVDHAPKDGGSPISIFESGAILQYLAKKVDGFLGSGERDQIVVSEWLMWQMGGLGPMAGQNHHFGFYASEEIPYAIDRYRRETDRLYHVLDRHLEGREFIAQSYSIADMACYPWIHRHERQKQDLAKTPNVKRWFDAISARPATIRAYQKAEEINKAETVTAAAKATLFNQGAHSVKK